MRTERAVSPMKHIRIILAAVGVFGSLLLVASAFAQQGPCTVTLDQAIQMAPQHNHTLEAARTAIQQNQAAEIPANLRPNPTFFADWEYLPVFTRQQGTSTADYLQNSTEGDMEIGIASCRERV